MAHFSIAVYDQIGELITQSNNYYILFPKIDF